MNTETSKPETFAMKESEPMKKVTCLLHDGAMYVPVDAVEKLTEVSSALERANEEIAVLREELEMERAAKDLAEAKCELTQLKIPVYRKLFDDMRRDYDREVSRRLKLEREMAFLEKSTEAVPAPEPMFRQSASDEFISSRRMWTHDEIEKIVHGTLDALEKRQHGRDEFSEYLRDLTDSVIGKAFRAAEDE